MEHGGGSCALRRGVHGLRGETPVRDIASRRGDVTTHVTLARRGDEEPRSECHLSERERAGGKQPLRSPRPEPHEIDAPCALGLTDEQPGDEEPGYDEEDVDTDESPRDLVDPRMRRAGRA